MLTAAIKLREFDGDYLFAGGMLILIALAMLVPMAVVRVGVWIDEGRPGTAGRLAAEKRRKPSTACPTSPDTTHGVPA